MGLWIQFVAVGGGSSAADEPSVTGVGRRGEWEFATLSGDFSVDTSQVVERLAADLDVPVMGGDVADSDAAACYFASPGVRLQWSR